MRNARALLLASVLCAQASYALAQQPQTVVGTDAVNVLGTFTRASGTITYTANTAFSTASGVVVTFQNVCRAVGKSVWIPQIIIVDHANQPAPLNGALWLFNASPTPIADNATFNVATTDIISGTTMKLVTTQTFTASTVANQNSGASGMTVVDLPSLGIKAKCAAGDRNLYGLMQVINAYIAVSAEQVDVYLKTVGID